MSGLKKARRGRRRYRILYVGRTGICSVSPGYGTVLSMKVCHVQVAEDTYCRRFSKTALMFAAGSDEKLYSYTIITTSSNPYLKFLHDRMPVILEPGSTAMATWLDPRRVTWSKELQSLLKPYEGELECYPVSKDVGKVGNNSPDFIVPINSKENKQNIANFFANPPKGKGGKARLEDVSQVLEGSEKGRMGGKAIADKTETKHGNRETQDRQGSKDNMPPITPKTKEEMDSSTLSHSIKRGHSHAEANDQKLPKMRKNQIAQSSPGQKKTSHSPLKGTAVRNRRTRSETSNGTVPKPED